MDRLTSPPHLLATSGDLRHIAEYGRCSDWSTPRPGIGAVRRTLALASALDRLHATPGLEEAVKFVEDQVDHLKSVVRFYDRFDSRSAPKEMEMWVRSIVSYNTLLTALRTLLPPGESTTIPPSVMLPIVPAARPEEGR